MHTLIPLLFALSTTAVAQEPEITQVPSTHYTLDARPGDLEVLVLFDRDAIAAAMSHDHVITPTTYKGHVEYNPNDVSQCDVQISFPVSALVVDAANARSRYTLPDTTSDANKKTITDNMLATNQLNGPQFGNITFSSTSCATSGQNVVVKGKLTIHGVSHAVTSTMKISADAKQFSAVGRFSASHSDFGMTPFSAMFGALKNAAPLTFSVNVKGHAN